MRCRDTRECFAKTYNDCALLVRTYKKDGECPFCKPKIDITNGKKYPYNHYYMRENHDG